MPAWREPGACFGSASHTIPRGRYGDHHQFGAEAELIGDGVRFGPVGEVPVHWRHEGLPISRSSDVHGVEVGDELVSEAKRVGHGGAGFCGEPPRFFAVPRIIGRVEPKDGGEDTQLDPTRSELVIAVAVEVATNVMTVNEISASGNCIQGEKGGAIRTSTKHSRYCLP